MNEREINFKYYWRDKSGSIKSEVISLDDFDDGENTSVTIDDEVLARCQFTGLQDKNGVDIYEGDMVMLDSEKPLTVYWSHESCGFEPFADSENNCGCCGYGLDGGEVEVVGNIYETPELTLTPHHETT